MKPSQENQNSLTADRLRELLHYDPSTGVFTWRRRDPRQRAKRTGPAGHHIHKTGYRCLSVDGQSYQSHRLAWLYMTGEWPPDYIDHVNGIRSDNRWQNLRLAVKSENNRNARLRKDNSSGYRGVGWHKATGKWAAGIRKDGKEIHLGVFNNPELAAMCYTGAAVALHGKFARFDPRTKSVTAEIIIAEWLRAKKLLPPTK